VIELRASIVLGSGSLSFELVRALVERLPVRITPRWVSVEAQPIGISDLLDYLPLALELPQEGSRVIEIGGADRVSYAGIMKEYATCRGLKRWMISVPVLTPRLSSLWLGLVTPIYARVGRALIDSIRHPTVVRDAAALKLLPICPKGIREAISSALQNEDRDFAETRWSDALSRSRKGHTVDSERAGPRIIDSRAIHVDAPPAAADSPHGQAAVADFAREAAQFSGALEIPFQIAHREIGVAGIEAQGFRVAVAAGVQARQHDSAAIEVVPSRRDAGAGRAEKRGIKGGGALEIGDGHDDAKDAGQGQGWSMTR
jgi:hypothetical protein